MFLLEICCESPGLLFWCYDVFWKALAGITVYIAVKTDFETFFRFGFVVFDSKENALDAYRKNTKGIMVNGKTLTLHLPHELHKNGESTYTLICD